MEDVWNFAIMYQMVASLAKGCLLKQATGVHSNLKSRICPKIKDALKSGWYDWGCHLI